MGIAVIIQDLHFSGKGKVSLAGTEVPEQPTETSAKYRIPLLTGSTPDKGELTVIKENTTYSSTEGAHFASEGQGIVYKLPEGEVIKAIALDFYREDGSSLRNNRFIFNLGAHGDADVTEIRNGLWVFTGVTDDILGFAETNASTKNLDDHITDVSLTKNLWHRIAFAVVGNLLYVALDGVLISNNTYFDPSIGKNTGFLVIGNGWRYRVNEGDRVFGGYIKNVDVWNTEITESEIINNSIVKS